MEPLPRRPSGALRRALRRAACLLIVLPPIVLPAPACRAAEITGDYRLMRRFVEDAGIVHKGWFEVAGDYAKPDGGRDLALSIIAALRFGRDVESGVIAGFLDRNRSAGARLFGAPLATSLDTTGLADVTLYGKYRLLRSPIEIAIGAAATVPLADSSRGLGPGTFRYRGFVGLRGRLAGATLVGNVGLTDRSDSRAPGRSPGTTSVLLGAGILLPLSYAWTFIGEIDSDGGRYEGEGTDSRALVGLDWRPTANLVIRGGAAHGLSEAAPDMAATLSAAFYF